VKNGLALTNATPPLRNLTSLDATSPTHPIASVRSIPIDHAFQEKNPSVIFRRETRTRGARRRLERRHEAVVVAEVRA
jgi:hypothetical protein